MRSRRAALFLWRVSLGLVSLGLASCRNCDDVGGAAPAGSLEPSAYDFGPLPLLDAEGNPTVCTAAIGVLNRGRTDLHVDKAELTEKNGDFTLLRAPTLVRLGGTEDVEIQYTVGGAVGDVQGTNVRLQTDDPDNDGVIIGSVTARVIDSVGAVALAACENAEGDEVEPCPELAFGPVQQGGAGRLLTVTVKNDGTADLEVSLAAINGGNLDFAVEAVRRGTQLVQLPFTVPPGRSTDCGAPSGNDNTLFIDVRYTPTSLGADADTLVIATDGIVGSTLEVPLSGVGSDVGIVLSPPSVLLGAVAEGDSKDVPINVSNVGTDDARVDESCIDVDGDETCDAGCTGVADDTALGGTLSCKVTKSDGSADGKGFILGPTDAQAGGDDERTVTVHWAPIAGNNSIPSTATLRLRTNILGNRVYTAPILGGARGELQVTSAGNECASGFCITTAGDPADTTTWSGTITLTLTNVGLATLNISDVSFEDGTPATIVDDYSIGALSTSALAQDASTTLVITYDNTDASIVDPANLIITHDGDGLLTTVPLDVLPPP